MLMTKTKLALRTLRTVEQLVRFTFTSGKENIEIQTSFGYTNNLDVTVSVPCEMPPKDTMIHMLRSVSPVLRANCLGEEKDVNTLSRQLRDMCERIAEDTGHVHYGMTHDQTGLAFSVSVVGNDQCPLRVKLLEECNPEGYFIKLSGEFFERNYGLLRYDDKVEAEPIAVTDLFDIVNLSEYEPQYRNGMPLLDANVTAFYDELIDAIRNGTPSELFTLIK